jgi:hypothetical protein
MYVSDLERSDYVDLEVRRTMVAVGWLEEGQPFSGADPGPEVRTRLREYVRNCWQPGMYRGFHTCTLCGRAESLNNLHIPGNGVSYVAPEGILHYIESHHLFSRPLVDSPLVSIRSIGSSDSRRADIVAIRRQFASRELPAFHSESSHGVDRVGFVPIAEPLSVRERLRAWVTVWSLRERNGSDRG